MANTELPDDSFIREVDEEYRRDQLKGLWQRYGRALIVGVVLGLAALAGGLYWNQSKATGAGTAGEDFTQALAKVETGDVAAAAPVLDKLAKSDRAGYAALATLQQAANALAGGDTATAVKLYASVQTNTKFADPFRELALVKATQIEFDTLKPADVVARLKPLSVPGNPWFGVAGEMTALAYLRDGKPAQALPRLNTIADDVTLPASLRGRTKQLAQTLATTTATTTATPVAAPAK